MLKVLFRILPLALLLALSASLTAAQDDTYTDPQGRFSVAIPTNWRVVENEQYVSLVAPQDAIQIHLLVLPLTGDLSQTTAAGWALVKPDFAVAVTSTQQPPSQPPVEATLVSNYRMGDDQILYQAAAEQVGEDVHLTLFEGQLVAVQERAAQISIIGSSYKITGTEETDLSGRTPRPVNAEIIAALEAYINELMPQFKIPGAVVAIVQDGQVVYTSAFGVRALDSDEPMTVDTHMMIGSSGKSLTTTLMAALVDDGLMQWDEPVVEVLPTFRMADPELTQRITLRNLVCACTGVPRRDLEMAFNSSELSAEDVIESLSTFEVFTDFGEAFQYSNQMVSTGGYAAAAAGGIAYGDLFDGYAALLRDRILDPVGMPNTTLYFDDVIRRGQYAQPHSLMQGFTYQPISLDVEDLLTPIAPAGGHWSTVGDMANYLIMQLNNGVAADGTRVVSEENLLITREPQVPVTADSAYGLGWFVGKYKGLNQIEHGGNTLGFTSDLAFLPDAGLGIVVLTNAQASNPFNSGVRTRLFDLVFDDVDADADAANIAFMIEQYKDIVQLPKTTADQVDAALVQPYLGAYTNAALGGLTLELQDTKLYADVGEFRTELLPVMKEDEPDVVDYYVTTDPPMSGLPVRLRQTDSGTPEVVIGQGVTEYIFTPAE
jgi:CubicO group peptidase (beta-lactamase class C family)